MAPIHDDPPPEASHFDIVRQVSELSGEVRANFTTIFKRLDRQDVARDKQVQSLTAISERLARLEARPVRLVSRKGSHAQRVGGVALIVIAVLGGISSAAHEGAAIVVAVYEAIIHPK